MFRRGNEMRAASHIELLEFCPTLFNHALDIVLKLLVTLTS